MSDWRQESNFIDGILYLFLGEMINWDLLQCIDLIILYPFDLINVLAELGNDLKVVKWHVC